jgi:large subunit ribosomal protein L1
MTNTTINRTKKVSKKYAANLAKIKEATAGKDKLELKTAVETLFSLEQPKFKDGCMVELHVKLNINPTKTDQNIRSSVSLPNGIGKKITIAAFVTPDKVEAAKSAGATIIGGEELIEEIKTNGSVNFDRAIAVPEMMKKIPAIARILGTAGVMPNPKTGTVGENVEEMIKIILAGKIDFKNDKGGNLHIPCGKINKAFTVETIVQNIQAAIEAIEKAKPEAVKKKLIASAHISSTMSPSIKIAV